LQLKIIDIIKKYEKMYPEINLTKDKWALTELIFKHFKPGNFFSDWHSEVGLTRPSRVLNMMIYLSEHDCGTQFFNQDVIKSRIGRLTIFPSYFTHTHRGQICPDNKDRYILGGYYNFIDIVICMGDLKYLKLIWQLNYTSQQIVMTTINMKEKLTVN
jgi:hypothetical protein